MKVNVDGPEPSDATVPPSMQAELAQVMLTHGDAHKWGGDGFNRGGLHRADASECEV